MEEDEEEIFGERGEIFRASDGFNYRPVCELICVYVVCDVLESLSPQPSPAVEECVIRRGEPSLHPLFHSVHAS